MRYEPPKTMNGDMNDEHGQMVIRLESAASAAATDGTTFYAYPRIEGMGSDDVAIAIVSADPDLGWRLTMLEGRYDGELSVTRTGHPSRSARRHLSNLVFHPAGRIPQIIGQPAVQLVRMLEDYEDDVVLHPRAVRTVVEARWTQDLRIPVVRPSPFAGLLRSAGIMGGVLTLANAIAVLGLLATWGHPPDGVRHYVLSTTLVTLGMLSMSPFLLTRLSRESQLFTRPGAQQRSRLATVRVGQMIIILAIMSAINGVLVLS